MSVPAGAPLVRTAAEVAAHELASGGAVRRLITHRDGSDVLLGLFRLEPGDEARFTLTGEAQEIYYLLAGRIRLRWSDAEAGAEDGDAILFRPGETYVVTALGTTPVELVYTVWPAPKEAV